MTTLTEHSRVRFRVPAEATAAAPPEVRGRSRDDVRMLVARPDGLQHRRFSDLADQLEPGDLVVVNNSATVNGEIDGVHHKLVEEEDVSAIQTHRKYPVRVIGEEQ